MKALVITATAFPYGNAMSDRIRTFCMLFNDLGYEVHVIAAKDGRGNKDIKLDFCTYEIVKTNRSEGLQSYIGNENLVSSVNNYLDNNKVEFVFYNSLGALYNKILNVCKKHNVKTILEQCEWFDVSSYKYKYLDPRFIRFTNNIKRNFIKSDGVFSISRLLDEYYKSKDVKSLIVASIFDVKNIEYNITVNNSKIKLIYTGSVGRSKEFLKPILEALDSPFYKDKIVFDIYGTSKKDVLTNIGNDSDLLNRLKDSVVIHGRVPYFELIEATKNSNYEIFIKPVRRSSNAQFPTKLAESMAYGTPVICNNTGDIGVYLKDGYNGFICDADNIRSTFDRILLLDNKEYNELRNNARKAAEESFDYRIHLDRVKKFIEEL